MSAAHQQRMRRSLAALIILAGTGLGGCTLFGTGAAPEPPAPPPPVVEALPKRPPPVAVPRPVRKPLPPGESPDSSDPTREAQPTDPDHVIGLTEGEATAWLGEPTTRQDAASGTIWRYVRPSCEVEIYFYLNLQQRIMRALHYEVRGNDGEQRSDRCFQQLVSERREGDGVTDPAR
jgi:hypothetical protein